MLVYGTISSETKNTAIVKIREAQITGKEILTILNSKFSEISEVKLSRDDAADIFMEAAMSMKGTKINQQLSLTPTETK